MGTGQQGGLVEESLVLCPARLWLSIGLERGVRQQRPCVWVEQVVGRIAGRSGKGVVHPCRECQAIVDERGVRHQYGERACKVVPVNRHPRPQRPIELPKRERPVEAAKTRAHLEGERSITYRREVSRAGIQQVLDVSE